MSVEAVPNKLPAETDGALESDPPKVVGGGGTTGAAPGAGAPNADPPKTDALLPPAPDVEPKAKEDGACEPKTDGVGPFKSEARPDVVKLAPSGDGAEAPERDVLLEAGKLKPGPSDGGVGFPLWGGLDADTTAGAAGAAPNVNSAPTAPPAGAVVTGPAGAAEAIAPNLNSAPPPVTRAAPVEGVPADGNVTAPKVKADPPVATGPAETGSVTDSASAPVFGVAQETHLMSC